MKSPTDVYRAALEKIMVCGAGQTPAGEDVVVAADAFESLVAELAAARVINIGINPADSSDATIDDEVFQPLSYLLAFEISPSFGVPVDQAARESLISRLRRIQASVPGYFVQTTEYF